MQSMSSPSTTQITSMETSRPGETETPGLSTINKDEIQEPGVAITDEPLQNDNEDEKQHELPESPQAPPSSTLSQMISQLSNSTPRAIGEDNNAPDATEHDVETPLNKEIDYDTVPIRCYYLISLFIALISIVVGHNTIYGVTQQIISHNNELECPYHSNALPVYVPLSSLIKVLSAKYIENATYEWVINNKSTNTNDCDFSSVNTTPHKFVLHAFHDCAPFKLDLELKMKYSKDSRVCDISLSFHEDPVFGIDLGTTYSCISFQKNILDKDDRRETTIVRLDKKLNRYCIPSVVYLTVDHRGHKHLVFGESAVNKVQKDPHNGISDIKRIVGRSADDNEIETFKQNHLFTIMDDNKSVFISNWNETLLFEEILSFLLSHLVEMASAQWYYDDIEHNPLKYIANVVVSVPALFHNGQRKAIRSSCHLSGLIPLKLVIEPSAASLAYSYYNAQVSNSIFLAFDFGGGTLDCSVMRCSGVECDVLSVHGDSALGGVDFDNVIRDIIMRKYETQYDWTISDAMYSGIHHLSERVKIQLTFSEEYQLSLKNDDEITKSVVITRQEFEQHLKTKQLVERAVNIAQKSIDSMKFNANNVEMILMIGGSSKIPIIQSSLRDAFGDILVLFDDIDPQLMVVTGSAIVGGSFAYSYLQSVDDGSDVVLTDVIPISIGFEICIADDTKVKQCGIMKKILAKNDVFPTEETIDICQANPNGNVLKLKLFEGDNKYTKHNYLLGKIRIDDIEPRDPMVCDNVLLRFMVDINGIFTVEATTNPKYGAVQKYNITIASENSKHGTLTQQEIVALTQKTISWYSTKSFPLRRKAYADDPDLTKLFQN